jgi:DNA-binding beta-propeller fold protein YncE
VAVSPDGRNVYVAAAFSSAVAVFDRDPNGELTQKGGMLGCVSEGGALGCAPGVAMNGVSAVTVSPDGKNVYLVARVDDSVVILDRNIDTGVLTQKNGIDGCVSETGTAGDCVNGVALDSSNDSESSIVVSADGRNVYVTSSVSDAVAPASVSMGPAARARRVWPSMERQAVAITPDGESVYVVSSIGAVAAFDRNLSTGALTQKAGVAACVSNDGDDGDCVDGEALLGSRDVTVSPDGRNVYSANPTSDGVAVFSRDVPSYDIDGDGQTEPLTDGLLLLRYLFGFTGSTLVNGAVDLVNCTRCTVDEVEAYIAALLGP